jgi:putative ABC transport system permease protein
VSNASWADLAPLPVQSRLRAGNVVTLYLTRLKPRWVEEVLAMVGIAIGVALLYAGGVATTSLSGPVDQLNRGIIGNAQLQLVARSPDGFSSNLYDKVRAVPGVTLAAPVLEAPASLLAAEGRRGSVTVYGADPSVVRLGGDLTQGYTATELAHQQVIAVTAATADQLRLKTGDLTRLDVAGQPHDVGIVVLGEREIGALSRTTIALAPIEYLQSLAGLRDRMSRVIVRAAPDRLDSVRQALQGLGADRDVDLRSNAHEPELFAKTAQPTAQATLIASVLSSLVGFMFAACAMLVTAPARRAFVKDLNRSGYSTSQIVMILLVDVVALGAVAGLLGVGLGELLSREGFSADAAFLQGAFPIGDERIVRWPTVALAILGGTAAAAVGVLAPLGSEIWAAPRPTAARRVAREGGSGDVRRAWTRVDMGATVGGLVLLAVALAVTLTAPTLALAGIVCLTVAVALLVPATLDLAVAATRWLTRRGDRPLMAFELALPQLESSRWRVRCLAIAGTGALAVFGASALHGARADLQAGLDGVTRAYDHVADVWVSPYGPGDLFAVSPVSAAAFDPATVPAQFRGVTAYRGSFLDVAGNRVWVRAPAPDLRQMLPPDQIVGGARSEANDRLRQGGWVTISEALARSAHVRVGERFTLPSPRPINLRVAAITTNLGWPGGAVVMNGDDYARAWGSQEASAYQLSVRPGVAPEAAAASLRRSLGRSGLLVETAAQRDRREDAASRAGLARLQQISTLTLVAAIIAMAAAMGGLLWQQRRNVARAKLDGYSTGCLWRSLAIQSGVLFGAGTVLGAVLSLLGQVLFSRGLERLNGFPVHLDLRIGIAAGACLCVSAVALLVVAIPGYAVARVPPSLRSHD